LTRILLGAAGPILSAATGNSQAGDTLNAVLPIVAPVLGSILGGQGNDTNFVTFSHFIMKNYMQGGSGPGKNPQDSGGDSNIASAILPLLGSFLGGGGGGGGGAPKPPSRNGQV